MHFNTLAILFNMTIAARKKKREKKRKEIQSLAFSKRTEND